MAGVVTPIILDSREVDIEESVVGQIRCSAVDDSRGDVQREVGVDLAMQRCWYVPGSWVTSLAGESDGRDLRSLHSVRGSADSTGEGHLNCDVGADIRASESKFRLSTIPELRRSDIDSVLDGCHRVGVDVVQPRVARIEPGGWASART